MANEVREHSSQKATTAIHTHETAPTQFVEADGISDNVSLASSKAIKDLSPNE
jgi:hypothetical protein